MKKIIGFSLGPVIASIISFITLPILSHLISTEQYGMSSLFQIMYNFLYAFVLFGYDQAFMREFNEENDKKKLFFNSIFPAVILSAVSCIAIIIFKSEISFLLFDDSSYTLPILLLGLCMPLFIIEKFLLLSLRMEEKGVKYSFWNIFAKVCNLVIVVLLLIFYERSFLCIVYALLFSQIIVSILMLLFENKYFSISPKKFDKKLFIRMTKYALPLIPIVIINWAMSSVDTIYLKSFSDFYNVGIYTMAYKFVNIVIIVQSTFYLIWAPVSYRWKKEEKSTLNYELVTHLLSFVLLIFYLFIMLFKYIIGFIISKSYFESLYILPFLLFYPIFITVSETTTLGIAFSRKSYFNIIISIISIVVNVVLNQILIPIYGALGAAIATGISYCVFFWCRTLISRKLWYKIPLKQLLFFTIFMLVTAFANSFVKNIYIISFINICIIILVILYYKNLLINLVYRISKTDKKSIVLIAYPNQYNKLKTLIESDKINVVNLELSKYNKLQKLFKTFVAFIKCDAVYFGYGQNRYNYYLKIAKFLKKDVYMHWIGSDVLLAKKDTKTLSKVNKVTKYHLSCSKLIHDELSELGINSYEVPIVPNFTNKELAKMPKNHSVLVYLPHGKEEFYGGNLIKQLASKYKEIEFNILANDDFCSEFDNVKNLGFVKEEKMVEIYDKISILIRIPEHDGLSLMLLEALLKGKEVIYCYKFPHTHKAKTIKELEKEFSKIIEKEPICNVEGHNFIVNNYDIEKISNNLEKILLRGEDS